MERVRQEHQRQIYPLGAPGMNNEVQALAVGQPITPSVQPKPIIIGPQQHIIMTPGMLNEQRNKKLLKEKTMPTLIKCHF
jgi:hypothetical protein